MNNAEMTADDAAKMATLITKVGALEDWKRVHDAQCTRTNSRLSRIELGVSFVLGFLLLLGWLINHSAEKIIGLLH